MSTSQAFEFFIQWHLTENCNLRCRHCYQGERGIEEMSLLEIKTTVAEVSAMLSDWSETYDISFSPSINITGGEPFLRKDLFAILAEIKKYGIDAYLLSNGTLITRERAKVIHELGVKGVQVSIEGPEETHDAIRGKGSFALSVGGIENLVDAGVSVTLNVTLSDLNAGEVKKIVAFASHVGARRVGFSRLVPTGRGRALLSHTLAPEKVKELYESLLDLRIKGLDIVTGDPVASQMKVKPDGDAGNIAVSGCAAGVSGLTILPNGSVTPCRRLPVSIGSVRRDSLRELWVSSPVLESLRDRSRYKGKCGGCSRWAHCRGCRAIAYAFSRSKGEDDLLAEDPQCFIERGAAVAASLFPK